MDAAVLRHEPETNHGKVMIEGVCKADSRTLHDRKAGRIDGGELVQFGMSKVLPGLLQIVQLAGEDTYEAGRVDGFLPGQRHVTRSGKRAAKARRLGRRPASSSARYCWTVA